MKVVVQMVFLSLVIGTKQLGKKENTIRYFLYTSSNPDTPQELVINDKASVQQSAFNSDNPTKILIHGYTKSAEEIPNPELRSAYLEVGDCNIISVDWKEIAAQNYISARMDVPLVGASVANFIDFLYDCAGLSFDSLVVIGFSLGAHCAGYAGKLVQRGRLPYIVGLDPASPLFDYKSPDKRLNSTDADYVETITTAGGTLKGFLKPIGSATFYANWGRSQPGCGIDLEDSCSHNRSVFYYAEAIKGYKFTPVYNCSDFREIEHKKGCDTAVSGIDIGDPTKILRHNGMFYFKTNFEEPFGHL